MTFIVMFLTTSYFLFISLVNLSFLILILYDSSLLFNIICVVMNVWSSGNKFEILFLQDPSKFVAAAAAAAPAAAATAAAPAETKKEEKKEESESEDDDMGFGLFD